MIHRTPKDKEHPFVRIDKEILNDKRLSWKAKGVLCYLLSKPDGWNLSIDDLVKHGIDGKATIRATIQELVKLGYLRINRKRDNGKFTGIQYDVFENPSLYQPEPHPENPDVGKPDVGKPDAGKPDAGKPHAENRPLITNDLNNKGSVITNDKNNKRDFFQYDKKELPKSKAQELLEAREKRKKENS